MVSLVRSNEGIQTSCEVADNLLLGSSLPLHLVELVEDGSCCNVVVLSSSGLSGLVRGRGGGRGFRPLLFGISLQIKGCGQLRSTSVLSRVIVDHDGSARSGKGRHTTKPFVRLFDDSKSKTKWIAGLRPGVLVHLVAKCQVLVF